MANKTYTEQVIEDQPFPQGVNDLTFPVSNQPVNGSYSENKIPNQEFPVKRVAQELIGTVLNTQSRKILQEFQFTKSGALQIGEYTSGVSGDVRISPDGITARNSAGNTTFNLDGDTGDATFAGKLRSGSIVTGDIVVGNNNVIIDGVNKRILVNDGTNDRVLLGFQQGGF